MPLDQSPLLTREPLNGLLRYNRNAQGLDNAEDGELYAELDQPTYVDTPTGYTGAFAGAGVPVLQADDYLNSCTCAKKLKGCVCGAAVVV